MSPRLLGVTSVLALCAALPALAEPTFNRIATFATPDNMAEGEDRMRPTSAEIISATEDGMTLIYTDSPLGVIGLIDITDPKAPKAMGNIAMGGEPTTAKDVAGRIYVGVNTSESKAAPSGKLVVAGSSSVTPVMEKLKEAYLVVNPNATLEIQQSDSSAGMNAALEGTADIGMASRELKDSEKAELTPGANA